MRTWNDYKKTMREEAEIFSLARAGNGEALVKRSDWKVQVADVDAKGNTALMLACYHGHVAAARVLLAAGSDPNFRDRSDNTILMGAAFKGHLDVVTLLVEQGAEVMAVNHKGQKARDFAQMFGRESVALYLKGAERLPLTYSLKDRLSSWMNFLGKRRLAL